MEDVILYSNGCPKCKVIKMKLEEKAVNFIETSDEQKVASMGYQTFPILQVNETIMDFKDANDWINRREKPNAN